MSQLLMNLIQQGVTKGIAEAIEANPELAHSRDALGVSALLWSVYTRQSVIRDTLLTRLSELDIFEAAATGKIVRVLHLISHDRSEANSLSPDGWSPLHLAAAFSEVEMCEALLRHDAQVNRISHNPQRSQPLNSAVAIARSLRTAHLLIDEGADVNFRQSGGFTALHQAAAAGEGEMVVLLLNSGADPSLTCEWKKTAEDYARERNHSEIAHLLRQ
jgi:ankyrin repeat protein